ncbi:MULTISPECIES: recombinase family protein [Dehalococcoides]|uniref:DNA invertase/resolvase n=5 Tax=root TaxID=1 RepID=D2BJ83_DEHMV|nr:MULTISPECIES: recombinase family protein [Dehalococcoides]AEI59439.1 DsiA [Dehalococcoides sp. enrichment culture clone WBC-2_Dhc_01]AEI59461.1 DsiA [Dehalococcoides sp. enrichment culture clone WL_Dhc_01]ACZ62383.1 DNA invertase/resolvase [Dehalococcoides mccartyi VS]AOV99935.1 dsiA [Dehalococcoides mccartyi]AQX73737.1 DNA invertase DsiA [Dehalococcoides mccartyi]
MITALYARVIGGGKTESLDRQLTLLRRYAKGKGYKVYKEYADLAPVSGLRKRKAWARLLEDGREGRFKLLIISNIVTAFYSVTHMKRSLLQFREWGVGVISISDPWLDTTKSDNPYEIASSLSRFAKGLAGENRLIGSEKSRNSGLKTGRPRVTDREGFNESFGDILERLGKGELSRCKAAKELGVGYATLKRLLDEEKG